TVVVHNYPGGNRCIGEAEPVAHHGHASGVVQGEAGALPLDRLFELRNRPSIEAKDDDAPCRGVVGKLGLRRTGDEQGGESYESEDRTHPEAWEGTRPRWCLLIARASGMSRDRRLARVSNRL